MARTMSYLQRALHPGSRRAQANGITLLSPTNALLQRWATMAPGAAPALPPGRFKTPTTMALELALGRTALTAISDSDSAIRISQAVQPVAAPISMTPLREIVSPARRREPITATTDPPEATVSQSLAIQPISVPLLSSPRQGGPMSRGVRRLPITPHAPAPEPAPRAADVSAFVATRTPTVETADPEKLVPRRAPPLIQAVRPAAIWRLEQIFSPPSPAPGLRPTPDLRPAPAEPNIQIGSIEVRVIPPAPPQPAPIPAPRRIVQIAPQPRSMLSRSFASGFGLKEG